MATITPTLERTTRCPMCRELIPSTAARAMRLLSWPGAKLGVSGDQLDALDWAVADADATTPPATILLAAGLAPSAELLGLVGAFRHMTIGCGESMYA